MVRYKRYKKRYSGTRAIKMRFQSFMDINTSSTSMQIITVSAGGESLLKRLPAQFQAYKYYKIGSVSVKLVPASTLPVDPTGLSYEAGEPGVDPRDQLTPGLMRITNGEDILENISGLSDEVQHSIYNNMLLDPRWFKWMLQSGVKRYASPRYWQIGQLHQDKWPGAIMNVPSFDSNNNIVGTRAISEYYDSSGAHFGPFGNSEHGNVLSSAHGFFQTGHSGRLGWLPTDGIRDVGASGPNPFLTSPPEVEVMKIVLPKAYKTEYYYRMFITETVYFKEPILQMPGYRPLDIFHIQISPEARLPGTYFGMTDLTDADTGGNYGNN